MEKDSATSGLAKADPRFGVGFLSDRFIDSSLHEPAGDFSFAVGVSLLWLEPRGIAGGTLVEIFQFFLIPWELGTRADESHFFMFLRRKGETLCGGKGDLVDLVGRYFGRGDFLRAVTACGCFRNGFRASGSRAFGGGFSWPIPVSGKNLGLGILISSLLLYLMTPGLKVPLLSGVGHQLVGVGYADIFQMAHISHLGGAVFGWVFVRWMLRPRVSLESLRREREKREG